MNDDVRTGTEGQIPPQWADAVVMESLYCRSCGYNLRGLQADGRCPECGALIWISVQHTVDPTASRLPSLRNPRAVGNAILVLTTCMLIGVLLVLSPNVVQMTDAGSRPGGGSVIARMLTLNWVSAIALAIAGIWAVRALAPPRGQEPQSAVWRDIWRIALGFAGWLVAGLLWLEFPLSVGIPGIRQRLAIHLVAAVFATIGLIGLRGVFNVIGSRSREYRRSQGGRQNVELIIAAISVGFVAAALYYASQLNIVPRSWEFIWRGVVWVSHLMAIVGLAYLVLNAWWIRRSLRKPPPALDQVLVPQLPPDTWIPDREE